MSDFLHIKDFTTALGKKHSLKVEYDKASETSKTLISEHQYQDLGIREINARLQQSSMGKMKVILLENIERMTPEAANAFLKTCEEPLPHRLIIATTAHSSQLLDTIISRALTLRFQELGPDELLAFADHQHIFPDDATLKELVCAMSMGKPGQLMETYALLQDNDELQIQFKAIIPLLTQGTSLHACFEILKQFKKEGFLESFLDGWIAYCEQHLLTQQAARRLKVRRMMKSTVNIENILMYGLLKE